MGKRKNRQLILLALLFAVAGVLVYRPAQTVSVAKPRNLQAVFGPLEQYRLVSSAELSEDVSSFLDLDDYTQSTYLHDGQPVTLYIGYYYSLEKVSAAHSPLVCFPGQGWQLDGLARTSLQAGGHTVNLAEMVASTGDRRQLVLYWYQAGETTSPKVYRNKLNAVLNRITGSGQEHAFVRVTVPMADQQGGREAARQAGYRFIEAFYPKFIDYINSGG